jgi:6-phosphogluconolactonase
MEFTVNYDLKIFQTLDELSAYFASLLQREINLAPRKFNLALSGGSTPKYIFNYFSSNHKNSISWDKINFFWGDERCVPPDNEESNYKMAFESLLSKVSIPKENIIRIKGEADPEKESKSYSNQIRNILPQKNQLPQFDLILLGLGEDGHTASIFPDQLQILNEDKLYSISIHPISKQKRITITGKVINNAKIVLFIVTGKNKAKVVTDILNSKIESKKYPASFIKPVDGKLFWLLDKEAAELLRLN